MATRRSPSQRPRPGEARWQQCRRAFSFGSSPQRGTRRGRVSASGTMLLPGGGAPPAWRNLSKVTRTSHVNHVAQTARASRHKPAANRTRRHFDRRQRCRKIILGTGRTQDPPPLGEVAAGPADGGGPPSASPPNSPPPPRLDQRLERRRTPPVHLLIRPT